MDKKICEILKYLYGSIQYVVVLPVVLKMIDINGHRGFQYGDKG